MSSLEEAAEILGCNAKSGIWLSTRLPVWHLCLGSLTGTLFDLVLIAATIPIAALVVVFRRFRPGKLSWNDYRGPVYGVLTSDEIVFLSALSSLFPRKPLSGVLLRRPRSSLVQCASDQGKVTIRFDNDFYVELYSTDSSDAFQSFQAAALAPREGGQSVRSA